MKRIAKEDRVVLAKLVQRYSAESIAATALKLGAPSAHKIGRPANNPGEKLSVWQAVEFRRRKHLPSKMPVERALALIAKDIAKYTVAPHPSKGALRNLYYEAKQHFKAHPADRVLWEGKVVEHLKNTTDHDNAILLPLRLKRRGDEWVTPIVDRSGLQKPV